MEQENTAALMKVLRDYAVPDPKIVGKLPKGGITLDFVGHADITKILLEIDPHWRWVPIAWDNGRPAIHVENGMATMWGELTLLGQSRLGVGSVRADKPELDKELVGDFLRNVSMRFGIALSLWSKQEWEDHSTPAPALPRTKTAAGRLAQKAKEVAEEEAEKELTEAQRSQFMDACAKKKLDHVQVAERAGVNWDDPIPASKLPAMRIAYKEMSE